MQSSEMSLMSGAIKFKICSLFGKALRKLCFAENLIKNGLRVPKIKTIFAAGNNKIHR